MNERALKFRDPERGRALGAALHRVVQAIGRPSIAVMHVCGSHEQAIARYGLRNNFPEALDLIMGPGCPVCITDAPEVDEAVALARQGVRVATYGDMLRVPGTSKSLADAKAEGGRVDVIYSAAQAVELAREHPDEEVCFFATGFETTAVPTAAILLSEVPENFSVLSAHKYIPPAMEIVVANPITRIEGFLAAGHAATITGYGVFEPFAARYGKPVVVAGFEPLDILAALVLLLEQIRDGKHEVLNGYPRCVTREGNANALETLWRVFEPRGGEWRGIAHIPEGNLVLKESYAAVDARRRFSIDLSALWGHAPSKLAEQCLCGAIMSGMKSPRDCALFGEECTPGTPVGACMVSSEGTCKIWHQYGGRPRLEVVA